MVFPRVCFVFVASSLKHFLCKKENLGKQFRTGCIAVHVRTGFIRDSA